jgi:hypothetical protein
MEFMDFVGFNFVDDDKKLDEFVILDMGTKLKGKIGSVYPDMDIETFNINLYNLITEIENWLKKNSSIPIDFKMEEPNK